MRGHVYIVYIVAELWPRVLYDISSDPRGNSILDDGEDPWSHLAYIVAVNSAARGRVDVLRFVLADNRAHLPPLKYYYARLADVAAFAAAHNGETRALEVCIREFDALRPEDYKSAMHVKTPMSEYEYLNPVWCTSLQRTVQR